MLVPLNGSSPLARGTPLLTTWTLSSPRLIPARAGNTRTFPASRVMVTAHPRSRGEHSLAFFHAVNFAGSSPLARGTPKTAPEPPASTRLIPARAGNTHRPVCFLDCSAAHPRSRGEH